MRKQDTTVYRVCRHSVETQHSKYDHNPDEAHNWVTKVHVNPVSVLSTKLTTSCFLLSDKPLKKGTSPSSQVLTQSNSTLVKKKGSSSRLHTTSLPSSVTEPLAIVPCCRLQLSAGCLIGAGSAVATRSCYLFVPISRCEALQPDGAIC